MSLSIRFVKMQHYETLLPARMIAMRMALRTRKNGAILKAGAAQVQRLSIGAPPLEPTLLVGIFTYELSLCN